MTILSVYHCNQIGNRGDDLKEEEVDQKTWPKKVAELMVTYLSVTVDLVLAVQILIFERYYAVVNRPLPARCSSAHSSIAR